MKYELKKIPSINASGLAADPITVNFLPAYDGGKLGLQGFDLPVVVDLQTVKFSESMPLLFHHNGLRRIGEVGSVDVTETCINMTGYIYPGLDDSGTVLTVHKSGGSWQASVGTNPVEIEQQEIVDKTIHINGQTLTGPFILCRDVVIRELSVVSVGASNLTRVEIEATAKTVEEFTVMEYSEEFLAFVADLGLVFDELTDAQKEALKAKFDLIAEEKAAEETIQAEGEAVEEEKEAAPIAAEGEEEEEKKEAPAITASLNVRRTTGAPRPNERRVIEASLLLNMGVGTDQLKKAYDQRTLDAACSGSNRNVTAHSLMRRTLQANGITVSAFDSPKTLAKKFVTCIKASGVSTRDWDAAGLMSSIQNRLLQARYEDYIGIARRLCRERVTADFRLLQTGRLSVIGKTGNILPAEEFPTAKLGESSQTYKIAKQGLNVQVAIEDLINDDLGVMDQAAIELAQILSEEQESMFWTEFFTGITTRYKAGNSNVVAQDLTIAGLGTANAAFKSLKKDGRRTGMQPAYILCPVALEATALDLYKNNFNSSTASVGNPWQGRFDVLSSAYIDDNAAAQWFLIPDPAIAPLGEIAYLDGQKSPVVESYEVKQNMTTVFQVWGTFGCAVYKDPVGVRSTGSGN